MTIIKAYSDESRNKILQSPLQGLALVDTFTAAKLLFPNEQIKKTHFRRVQRLCKMKYLEYYKLGRVYRIVKHSIYAYIETAHSNCGAKTSL